MVGLEASRMTRRFAVLGLAIAWTLTAGIAAQHVHGTGALTHAQEDKLGAGVTLDAATPIAELYATPEKFVGKTIRVDGIVTAVCQEMGCWMALGHDEKGEQTVRFKVDHGAGIVFPVKAKGRKASAEGVFERIAAGDKEGQEAAHEHTSALKASSEFAKTYQIKVTGAVLR
jgi:hypothetical protein